MSATDNPKRDPDPGSNTQKDPEDWVSGDEPMTASPFIWIRNIYGEGFSERIAR